MKRREAVARAVAAERARILAEVETVTKVWCEGHSTKLVSYHVVKRIVTGAD